MPGRAGQKRRDVAGRRLEEPAAGVARRPGDVGGDHAARRREQGIRRRRRHDRKDVEACPGDPPGVERRRQIGLVDQRPPRGPSSIAKTAWATFGVLYSGTLQTGIPRAFAAATSTTL